MPNAPIAIEDIVDLETPVAMAGSIRTAETSYEDIFDYLLSVAIATG